SLGVTACAAGKPSIPSSAHSGRNRRLRMACASLSQYSVKSTAAAVFVMAVLAVATVNAEPERDTPVQVQMRNVALHIDADTVVFIRRLRGVMVPTKPGGFPVFDDKHSFVVRIDSGEMAMSADSLSRLLNGYVFAYEGSPLKKLRVETVGRQLKMTGSIHKGVSVPFTILADARVDEGRLRLHTTSIKALGIPARGLLSFFGLELDKLVQVRSDRGVSVDGDDLVIDVARLLPPPRVEGRLQAVRIEPGRIVQVFGPGTQAPLRPPVPDTNYMYYRGGTLRFGKLTMADADMELIDEHPEDPFDFFQDRYNDQL